MLIPIQYSIPDPKVFQIPIPSFFSIPDNGPARDMPKVIPAQL
jgi:hypothetical protein